ncbi:MAG: DcaP family trimeric outer membrane transporter [Rikenellaceae bacterium]
MLLIFAGILASVSSYAQDSDMPMESVTDSYTSYQPQYTNLRENSAPILLMFAKEHDRKLKVDYREVFASTMSAGIKESQAPRFVIVGDKNRFLFGIGGFVQMTTSYDIDGIIDNKDFVTYDIPMTENYATRQQGQMSVSSSRLFFKVLGNTRALGLVEGYLETDFYGEGNTLRLRKAYVSFKGFTFGQTVSTFCDLTACPTTVDQQGPNAYTYNRNLMVRYHLNIDDHWSMAVAAEKHDFTATYGSYATAIPQRVPDIPLYFQYSWGQYGSHIRGSGVVRYLQYHNTVTDENQGKFAWGAQLSGNINAGDKVCFFMQGVYGKGIADYIQDLTEQGLDMVPNPSSDGELQTVRSLGLLGGIQFNASKKVFVSAGYSETKLFNNNGYYDASQYRGARYAVANVFWSFVQNCQAGLEYIYGTRTNMDKSTNQANRVEAMVRYSF